MCDAEPLTDRHVMTCSEEESDEVIARLGEYVDEECAILEIGLALALRHFATGDVTL